MADIEKPKRRPNEGVARSPEAQEVWESRTDLEEFRKKMDSVQARNVLKDVVALAQAELTAKTPNAKEIADVLQGKVESIERNPKFDKELDKLEKRLSLATIREDIIQLRASIEGTKSAKKKGNTVKDKVVSFFENNKAKFLSMVSGIPVVGKLLSSTVETMWKDREKFIRRGMSALKKFFLQRLSIIPGVDNSEKIAVIDASDGVWETVFDQKRKKVNVILTGEDDKASLGQIIDRANEKKTPVGKFAASLTLKYIRAMQKIKANDGGTFGTSEHPIYLSYAKILEGSKDVAKSEENKNQESKNSELLTQYKVESVVYGSLAKIENGILTIRKEDLDEKGNPKPETDAARLLEVTQKVPDTNDVEIVSGRVLEISRNGKKFDIRISKESKISLAQVMMLTAILLSQNHVQVIRHESVQNDKARVKFSMVQGNPTLTFNDTVDLNNLRINYDQINTNDVKKGYEWIWENGKWIGDQERADV